MDWVKDGHTPTSMDIRDDRINLFVDLHSNKQTYITRSGPSLRASITWAGQLRRDVQWGVSFLNGAGRVKVCSSAPIVAVHTEYST